jgi:hypothetical protein
MEHRYKVQWLDSCRYRLTELPIDKSATTELLDPVVFQITAVTNISYKVDGWVEGTTFNTYSFEIFRATD